MAHDNASSEDLGGVFSWKRQQGMSYGLYPLLAPTRTDISGWEGIPHFDEVPSTWANFSNIDGRLLSKSETQGASFNDDLAAQLLPASSQDSQCQTRTTPTDEDEDSREPSADFDQNQMDVDLPEEEDLPLLSIATSPPTSFQIMPTTSLNITNPDPTAIPTDNKDGHIWLRNFKHWAKKQYASLKGTDVYIPLSNIQTYFEKKVRTPPPTLKQVLIEVDESEGESLANFTRWFIWSLETSYSPSMLRTWFSDSDKIRNVHLTIKLLQALNQELTSRYSVQDT
ncbi:hypothetical protein BDN72DRAFT_905509 [Pluteus cervinus]|uniref:Uncharacterized protein n=1 Tax=Pluteus cervinus TaxID=181527 RepID=A0ACD3A1Y0_9AGAR|nr:hypothetical protein BDN72DRAFT_905509 [Pluteus cervinus]